jgi:LysM repeat protein
MKRGTKLLTPGVALAVILALAIPVSAQDAVVHIVQPGENLFRIALRYGVTVEALAAANGLSDASRIYVGQRLVIPRGGVGPATSSAGVHVVQRGENLFRIALRYGTTFHALAAANGIVNASRIYVGQRLLIPGPASAPSPPTPLGQTYTVRRGDTLSAIALRYGVSMWVLAQANDIRNPSFIYAGQVLHVPGSATPPQPPATTDGNTGRWIDVDLSGQRLTAYEGDTPVRSTRVSTGLPHTPTPTGRFRIYAKYISDDMAGPGYYLPDVPYTLYFYRGYSLHGTYWHSNFGSPMSHGCINLPTTEAQWLYAWASVGTPLSIHE